MSGVISTGEASPLKGAEMTSHRSSLSKNPNIYRSDGKLTKEYLVWVNMRQRCNNPNRPDWKHYGGRGISVCERWNVFENFLEDMGLAPLGYSIDRIDVDGNYEFRNCRWATSSEQVRNRRRVTHCCNGHELTPDNCYVKPGGKRNCKTCHKLYGHSYYLQHKDQKRS